MLNLEPIKLSEEQFNQLASASQTQVVGRQPKTTDPNFPLFDIPVNDKVMIYVPNFVVQNADGSVDIQKDRFPAHTVRDGKSYKTVRCTNGLNFPEYGLDGSCPLCSGAGTCWELFNFEYEAQAKLKGIDTSNTDSVDVKTLRSALKSKFAIKGAEIWYTFPIVVIDTVANQNGSLAPQLTDGKVTGTTYWYSVRENTYNKRWKKILGDMMPAKDHPAGMWFLFNYTYDAKGGQHDKMGSANALTITNIQPVGDLAYLKEYEALFDEQSKEFTPVKAMQTIYNNMLSDVASLQKLNDAVLVQTNDKLRLYQNSAMSSPMLGGATQPQIGDSSVDAQLQNFGATPVAQTMGTQPAQPTQPAVDLGSAPQVPLGQVPPSMGVQ